jgi:hypothetical protein
MGVKTVRGAGSIVLWEDSVGSSTQYICYPGISSCIAITGVSGGGVVGCHITVATPQSEIDQIFQLMKTAGGQGCPEFYVIGALTKFKGNTKVSEMNSRKKISSKVKAMINPNAVVKFVDIATLGCGDAHILVEKSGGAISAIRVATLLQVEPILP